MNMVPWSELDETPEGLVTLRGSPFTGLAIQKWPDGRVHAHNEYVNGVQHGA